MQTQSIVGLLGVIGVGGYAFTTTRNYVAGIEARAWDTERKLNILSKAIETLISSLTELKTAISSVSSTSSSESTYITSICTQVRVLKNPTRIRAQLLYTLLKISPIKK